MVKAGKENANVVMPSVPYGQIPMGLARKSLDLPVMKVSIQAPMQKRNLLSGMKRITLNVNEPTWKCFWTSIIRGGDGSRFWVPTTKVQFHQTEN